MANIEDKLWTRLIATPDADAALATRQPPSVRRRSPRAPLAAGGVAIAGLIVAAALTTGGTGTTPAYAVTVNPNGLVSVTLNEVLGVSGANEQLKRLGVRARIAKIEAGCAATGDVVAPGDPSHEQISRMVEPQKIAKGLAGLDWVIHPEAIPPGDTLLITAQLANEGRPVAKYHGKEITAVASGSSLYRGAAPACQPPGTFYPG